MKKSSPANRRGLAPLELVLALPLLLGFMALMINFGTVASWRLRSLSISRHMAFSMRWPRSGQTDPKPAYWPGSVTPSGPENVPLLDDSRVQHAVVRGPLPGGVQVNSTLLDPSRGLLTGTAEITRRFPLLGKLGSYHLTASTYLLDDHWQYERTGLGNNQSLRIPVIYQFSQLVGQHDTYLNSAVANYRSQYSNTALGMYSPLSPLVSPDRDSVEYGALARSTIPSFVPRLRRFCSLDPAVADASVDNLILRITGKDSNPWQAGVADRMATGFTRFYNAVIRGAQNSNPPLPTAPLIVAQMQAKIDLVKQFWDAINPGRSGP